MKVAITIPAYNEEKTIGKVIDEIRMVMEKTKYNYFIHVLDDGSKDNTVKIAKSHKAIVNSNPRNLGLIKTFQNELEICIKLGADVIVHTDADGQYPSSEIPNLLKKIEQGYDLVTGSRFKKSTKHMKFAKRIGNIAFAKAISKLVGAKITDSTTGFRAFTKEVASEIKFINNFTYTQEQLIRAGRQKFKVIEIPINSRKTRDSRLFGSAFEYAVKAWINIFRIYRDYNPIKFFGSIGLGSIFIGFLIGLAVIVLSFANIIRLDSHIPSLLLSILFGMIGLQILLFGFLADMMKQN